MAVNRPAIVIVGCGPGSPDYLTPAARRTVEEAEVLVGAKRLLDLFPEHPGERIPVGADLAKALDEIESRFETKRVAVLVTGDPGLCSLAQPVIKRFGRDTCEVIPGISSVQVAFARIGVDWYNARIVSVHGRELDVPLESLTDAEKIAVLAGGEASLASAAEIAQDLPGGYRVYVCENLTLPDECVREVEPADLASLQTPSRTIILVVKGSLLS